MFVKKSITLLKVLTFVLFAGIVITLVACDATTNDTTDETTTEIVTTDETTIDTTTDATNTDETTTDATTTNETTTDTTITDETTTEETTTEETVNMDATLTDLTIDGTTVMDFSPSVNDYVMVLSSTSSGTPLVEGIKYATLSTIVIDDAIDVNSTVAAERTTTITVTTEDGLTDKVYTILFETMIAPVNLATADDFVILAETGISTETSSIVTGSIGVSPVAATYITGFSLMIDSTGTFSTSSQIVGEVYASDYTTPTPSYLTTAIADMRLAYADAASRDANYTELYSGDLSGKTLTTGVYKFGSGVLINEDLTLDGSANDVWIFQIDGALTQAAGIEIILTGGALAENIFWQVADTVSIGTGAHFEGTILAKTNISLGTNATIIGNLYAQTAVTLDAATVTKP